MPNPLLPSKENMKIGQQKYDTFCSPCHGFHAEGDSRLRGQFPNPPSLHSEKVRNWTDGRIFHVIMEGQNIMPAYNTQLTNDEKWAVILHLRALQRSLNAKETDLQ
jgi:mono/diheme cytochrome c family protein